ncbi:class E sortase [Brachybacterium sp. EF45031]|uniref:class E sortase n=1 Tax=Brachybacterium sillae TaxID=2810536 RepID=UPI00217F2258|nr:class E sortase [Brachybacterium sillae]MCS6712068.1 class E sortase [Brachybacterium sillae]
MSVRRAIGSAIGILGELMITLGALLMLFLVWQLWWTDVTAGRDQEQIVAQLDKEWAPVDGQEVATPRTDAPPPVAQPQDEKVWGTMWIPAFDKPRMPLAEGVSLERVLNVKGTGHYPDTALPGEVGNFSVAGHRTTYARPLHDIDRLQSGDPIVVETAEAFYVYEVTASQIVMPDAVEVIAPVPGQPGREPTERMLTLTACHPLYSARERYIVHARFAYWTPRSEGVPPALADEIQEG